VSTCGLNEKQKVQRSTTHACKRGDAQEPVFGLSLVGKTPTSGNLMIRRLFSSQLRINMFSGVAVTVVNTGVLAIAYPIYLNFLGYEKYGVWLVLATVLSFAQLGDLGISQAIMKLVAEEYGRGNIQAIQQYVTTAIAILMAAGAAALIVILTFRTQITSVFKLTGENAQMVLWLLPYIASLSIYVFIVHALNAALSGLGRMDLANWAQSAGRIAAVAAAASLLYSGYGIESLLIGSILSYMLIHIVTVILIWRIAHIRLLRIGNLSGRCCKRLLGFGLGLFGGSVMNMLLSPFNKLMLARYAGVSTIPVYEIAFNGSMQVRALIAVGLSALMPEVSRIGANMTGYARDRIAQLNYRAIKLIFLFGLPVYAGLFVFCTFLFRIRLRERFVTPLPDAFRIMLIATFASLLCVPAYYTLLGLGRVRQCFYAYSIQAGTNALVVVSVIMLGASLSVIHVVWAVLAAMATTSVYLISQNYRTLRSIA
jgi:O-antigen/teichoic acid export membrane protein